MQVKNIIRATSLLCLIYIADGLVISKGQPMGSNEIATKEFQSPISKSLSDFKSKSHASMESSNLLRVMNGEDCDDDSDESDSEAAYESDDCSDESDEYGYYALAAENKRRSHLAELVDQGSKSANSKLLKYLNKFENQTSNSKIASSIISKFEHELEEGIDQEKDDSTLALLWLKLANVVLPFKKVMKQSQKDVKKQGKTNSKNRSSKINKKFSVDQESLLQESEVGHSDIDLVNTKEVPAVNVVDNNDLVSKPGLINEYQSDDLLNSTTKVNLTGLLSRLFGTKETEDSCDEEDSGEDVKGDSDDCEEEDSDDCEEEDKYDYNDPCNVYETSVNYNATNNHGNFTSRGHSNKTNDTKPKGIKSTSSKSNYTNVTGFEESFGTSLIHQNGLNGLLFGLVIAMIFA